MPISGSTVPTGSSFIFTTITGSVEMKNKKNMMVLALVLVSSVTMTVWAVQASGNNIGQYTNANAISSKANNLVKVAPQAMICAHTTEVPVSNVTESLNKPPTSNIVYSLDDVQLEEINNDSLCSYINKKIY